MNTISDLRDPLAGERQDGISDYCRDLFSCFARSDQRRWGEVYLRGLLHAPGRRTPANISEKVLGRRAVQPIQQFVNQSTWECDSVRRFLAERASTLKAPDAWAFDEVVFPKNGTRSVGVGRQFVGSAGRVMNCQIGLATSMVHGEHGLPVNWHLMLPRHWDDDHELRSRAHVPAHERHRPRWSYVLESLDEILEWDVPDAPVLANWSYEPQVEPLLLGLEQRGFGYVVEVGATTVLPVGPGRRPATRRVPAAELVQGMRGWSDRAVLARPVGREGQNRQSQYMVGALSPAQPGLRTEARYLVVDWPFGRQQPRAYWLTNLPADRLADTVALAERRHHVVRSHERLREHYGLGDFEGRSFRGWHHHVTLASAALGFHRLQELEEEHAGAR